MQEIKAAAKDPDLDLGEQETAPESDKSNTLPPHGGYDPAPEEPIAELARSVPGVCRFDHPTPIANQIVPRSEPDPDPDSRPAEVDRRIARLLEENRCLMNENRQYRETARDAQARGTEMLDYSREGRRLFREFSAARGDGPTASSTALQHLQEWAARPY